MKCKPGELCFYCILNPPRLPQDVFASLHFLPDPTIGRGDKYKKFEDLYGTETTDSDRPSLKTNPVQTENDKKYKHLFNAGI